MGACVVGATCAAPLADCDGMGPNGCEQNTQTSVAACGGAPHLDAGGAPPPPGSVGEPYAFARRIDEVDALSLPQTSRPGAQDTPDAAPIFGPFTLTRTQDGVQVYEAPLPVRMRELFYYSAPRGMKALTEARDPGYQKMAQALLDALVKK